jgi:hypothetical protein
MALALSLTDSLCASRRDVRVHRCAGLRGGLGWHRWVVRNNPSDFANPKSHKVGGFEAVNSRTKKELIFHTKGGDR